MKYRISDVASINNESVNKRNYKGIVNYVDTSSVVNGIFEGYQCYSNIFEAPSRARRLVSVGDTIISTVRPNMRHVGFISKQNDYIYSTGFAIVSPKRDKIDPYYLYLFLSSNRVTEILQSIGETSTSTYPSVKPSDIANLVIDIPSLIEQRTIAKRIRWIDEKKGVNNQINANLLELINTVYDKFYSNFPPTEYKTIKNIFYVKTTTYKISKHKNTKVWHFSIPNFDNGKIGKLENTSGIKSNKKIVNDFSVLISKLNPKFKRIWAPNLTSYPKYESVSSPEFIQVSGSNIEQQAVAFAILNSKDYSNFLVSNATGSTNSRQRVKPQIAYSYKIPFNIGRMRNLGNYLKPLLQQIQENEAENNNLQNLKETLLVKLF